jgi:hypothetical protein
MVGAAAARDAVKLLLGERGAFLFEPLSSHARTGSPEAFQGPRLLKTNFVPVVIALLAIAVCGPIANRWRGESHDRTVAILAEWSEARDLTAREAWPSVRLLQNLKSHGASAILFGALTVGDLVGQHKAAPVDALPGHDPLDVHRLKFGNPADAARAQKMLSLRGVADISLEKDGVTLSRAAGSFQTIRDVEAEFDPLLVSQAAELGLFPFYRINRDPWVSIDAMRERLSRQLNVPGAAFLFNSDEVPGGLIARGWWRSWILRQGVLLPFFEFHPSKAAAAMAALCPSNTFRGHTIPSLELKDLTPEQETSRWRRAVQERSCRILLVHATPNDSTSEYFSHIARLRDDLVMQGWRTGLPSFRPSWRLRADTTGVPRSVLAFLVAMTFPWWGLRLALRQRNALQGFLTVCLVTLIGGSVASTLALSPSTQLEIATFRGIKLAFLMGWVGSVFFLYSLEELKDILRQYLRRVDVLIAAAAVGLVIYAMIRSGNATAAWKSPWEQTLRDHLERWLWVRPRFKEFAFGNPLLFLGLSLGIPAGGKRGFFDGRAWIALGMVGQASIINTFCHLHSPIVLAYLRSIIGIVIGAILGGILIRVVHSPSAKSRFS